MLALLTIIALLFLLGITCLALALYWAARASLWNPSAKVVAAKNIRFDLIAGISCLTLVYGIAFLNSANCWVDGGVGLPALKYRCDDGVLKPHRDAFRQEKIR